MVLKQCGQLAITFFTPYFENVAMFCCACSCQRYSLPIRRAGSPLQVSSVPRMANETFAARRIATRARATRWLRRATGAGPPAQEGESPRGVFADGRPAEALGPAAPGARGPPPG